MRKTGVCTDTVQIQPNEDLSGCNPGFGCVERGAALLCHSWWLCALFVFSLLHSLRNLLYV